MILIIDNYDSFTYNLYQLVGKYTEDILVKRNDKITVEEIEKINPSHIIISPGPGNPTKERDFGICSEIIHKFINIPILGVCLGHQGIFTEYGGKIKNNLPVHGKKDLIIHKDSKLFKDIPEKFEIVRYHSLICDDSSVPEDLIVTSFTEDNIIMSIEHVKYPTYGIQFHPESIGSSFGDVIIKNFLEIKGWTDIMNVIDDIVENKKNILQKSKEKKDLNILKQEAEDFISTRKNKFRFREKLKDGQSTKLIAEYKTASPSQGDISTLKAEDVIPIYEKYPVDMISVLTEESRFKSNMDNFRIAESLTDKPLLRKDFVIDEYMIYEAALNNASCVLLINGVCPDIEEYMNISEDLGLDTIVECHSLDDIESVVDYNPKIIGINNRNLSTLTIDLETTNELKDYVPNYLISESGVKSIEDAQLLKSYGADAILVGTSILKGKNEKDIGKYITQLNNSLKK